MGEGEKFLLLQGEEVLKKIGAWAEAAWSEQQQQQQHAVAPIVRTRKRIRRVSIKYS